MELEAPVLACKLFSISWACLINLDLVTSYSCLLVQLSNSFLVFFKSLILLKPWAMVRQSSFKLCEPPQLQRPPSQ